MLPFLMLSLVWHPKHSVDVFTKEHLVDEIAVLAATDARCIVNEDISLKYYWQIFVFKNVLL